MENIEEIKDDMFIGFNEKGEKTTFYKLLEFDSTETGKHYLAYTDNSVDEKGNVRAYGSIVSIPFLLLLVLISLNLLLV